MMQGPRLPMRKRRLAAIAGWVLGTTGAAAQAPLEDPVFQGTLTLERVLESSIRHHPQILRALADARAQRGRALAARGAFDLSFEQSYYGRLSGFYDGWNVNSQVTKELPYLNGRIFGGYRVGDGEFPIYEDELNVLDGGELKFGLGLSLLRYRGLDPDRLEAANETLGVEQADIETLGAKFAVQRSAMRAFKEWLAAGEALRVYQSLLSIAEDRNDALIERVTRGDAAEILLVENRQNLIRREALVIEAERRFLNASNNLALFVRGPDGAPLRLDAGNIETSFPPLLDNVLEGVSDRISGAQSERPEIRILDTEIEKARNTATLRRNETLPQLDLSYEVSRDFGDVRRFGTSSDLSRRGTDNVVGLELTVPLQNRALRGRLSEARNTLEALELRRRFVAEQIRVEIQAIANDIAAARTQVTLAREEVSQAEALEVAERRRFRDGASDFFLVNIREQNTADARVRRVSATLAYFRALADFYAATADRDALMIR